MFADYHVHTEFSDDSVYPMEQAVKDAIAMGMEFGIQTHTIPRYEALFQKYSFDFIILSIHQVEDQEFWIQDFQKGKSQEGYNRRYYEEMQNVVKRYQNYSVLGHIDLITRYDENGVYPFEKVEPVISEILRIVIENGKGIELNTSYHRYGLKDVTPSVNILKRYRELGGDIITIGSDSHRSEHLGAYIEDARSLLKSLGFRYFCTYDQMRPVYHKL